MVEAVPFRADLLRIEGWNFGGDFWGLQIIIFSLRVCNSLIFARPSNLANPMLINSLCEAQILVIIDRNPGNFFACG
jgi:hypothetical protein